MREVADAAPRRATASLVEAWGRALDAHGQAVRTGTERTRDDAVAGLEKARDELITRVQELEHDRSIVERLALCWTVQVDPGAGGHRVTWSRQQTVGAPPLALRDVLSKRLPELPR